MNEKRIEKYTRFLKAFNKYSLITWAVFVLILGVYYLGFENLIKRGPLKALAQESSEGSITVDLPEPEPIEGETASEPMPEPAELPPSEALVNPDSVVEESQSTDPQASETVDLPPSEAISQYPDSVVEENSQAYQTSGDGQIAVDLPPTEPMVDSSSPDVSVVEESAPQVAYATPTPYATSYQTPYPTPREVVREVVRYENNGGGGSSSGGTNSGPAVVGTRTPTPTPTPTPQNAIVTLRLVENVCSNNRVLVRFNFATTATGVSVFYLDRTGTPVATASPGNPTATVEMFSGERASFTARAETGSEIISRSNTVDVTGATCSTPTPTPTSTPVAVIVNPGGGIVAGTTGGGQVLGVSAQPSPRVALAQTAATPRPTIPAPTVATPTPVAVYVAPSPSPVVVVQKPIATVTPQGQLIPVAGLNQSAYCPSGYTRIQETDNRIVCTNDTAQTRETAKQVVLTGAGSSATSSAIPAPSVVTIYKTDTGELPKTGLPLAAVGFGSLIPLGLGLRKYYIKGPGSNANSLWMEKQLKS